MNLVPHPKRSSYPCSSLTPKRIASWSRRFTYNPFPRPASLPGRIPAGMALANKTPSWTMAGIGSGFLIASIPLHSLFKKKSDRALKIYEDEVMKAFRSRWAYGGG